LIFIPSAFTKFTGRNHWLALNRVRAIENQCFIVAVNQSGMNSSGVRFFGSSIVVDPWGRILKEGPAEGNSVITYVLDMAPLESLRRDLPALKKIRKNYPVKIFRPSGICGRR
jgi:predicted amidohydrolase